MFEPRLIPVWIGIILLSGMFLLGQDTWPPSDTCTDNDRDGYGNPASSLCPHPELDCMDNDPLVNPGTSEVCENGLDDDCNGTVDNGCCMNQVADPGFEDDLGWPEWDQFSSNFGTPLTDKASSGKDAHQGQYLAWFGGIGGFEYEQGWLRQTVIIPVGADTLRFWFSVPSCGNTGNDYLEVNVDGNPVFYEDSSSPLCDVFGYVQESVIIAPYADGEQHTLEFWSETFGNGITDFFVDDIDIEYCIP